MPRSLCLAVVVLLAACGGDLVEPATYVLELRTVTTGAPIDPDGYAVRLDDGLPIAIGVNVTRSVPGLAPGSTRSSWRALRRTAFSPARTLSPSRRMPAPSSAPVST